MKKYGKSIMETTKEELQKLLDEAKIELEKNIAGGIFKEREVQRIRNKFNELQKYLLPTTRGVVMKKGK
jgi:ribosomal protein S20